jgi:lipopolysaccharide/colanic/teichoic acid biosynthesis glycosyltransferase
VEKYVGGAQPVVQYNLAEWKYRLFKRTFDILSALFVLTIGLPVVILNHAIQKNIRKNVRYHNYLRDFIEVLRGRKSVIGVYPIGTRLPAVGKVGLTGLAHVHSPENLSLQALQSLNEFYVKHYSIWLDVDILVTLFFRLRRYEQRS